MARQQPADHLAEAVIDRSDFVDACRNRDLGAVLSIAKQRGGAGFTASHLARRCNLTVSRVQDYIAGRVHAQNVEVFTRVAEGLHIPGRLFDLAPLPWEQAQSAGSAASADNNTPDHNGDVSVLRRDFMQLGSKIAAVGALAGIASQSGVPSRENGPRVGASSANEIEQNIIRLRKLDDHLGGADTYQLYKAEVDKIARMLKANSYSGVTKHELLSLFAEQAQQTGWAAFDSGRHADAKQLFERSFVAAKESGNTALAANALAFRAYQLVSTGSNATRLTAQSVSLAEKSGNPTVKALLYERGAWTFAKAGEAETTAKLLSHAEDSINSDTGEDGPNWASWASTPTELAIMTGRCWTELKRPLRAVPSLETALSNYGDHHARDKALYLSWLADAYIDAGEPEQAVEAAGRALDLSSDVASVRPQQRMTEVLDRLKPHQNLDAVSTLLNRAPDPVDIS